MKVLYLIQSHKNPEQIFRLVQTLKKSSPQSQILISHDFRGCHLDVTAFHEFPGVNVIRGTGGRGDFSIVQGYLNAIDWLFSHNVEFDWLANITGQDYPIQPLPKIEKFLAESPFDGFLEYFDVLSDLEGNLWGSREGSDRYLYQYWRSGQYLPLWKRAIIKIPRMVINNVQPLVRINSSYGLMLGVRTTSSPFNENFKCYAGSYFKTLSRKCVEYLHHFCQHNPELINYYKKTCIPDESFVQTVLVNSGQFHLCNDYKRYIDWTGTRHGHPRTLNAEDYSAIIRRDVHFARKFDMTQDSRILDMLDARVLKESSPVTLGIS
ncbi:beta-1,6-N-acetylglucosaminyltransferase [Trichocoleus sp. ST-U3]